MSQEMRCPECLGTLVTSDGETASCPLHGGAYRILVTRVPPRLPPPLPEPGPKVSAAEVTLPPDTRCAQHPNVVAAHACRQCGTPVCGVCAMPGPEGSRLCPACMGQWMRSAGPSARLAGMHCVQHPAVPATAMCQTCGAFMCATCDFALPGGLHLCPACATAPKAALSGKRKGMLIASFALAVWCSVGMGLLVSGALSGYARTRANQQTLGVLLMLLLMLPAVIGLALGCATRDRRLANPPVIWVATIWNGLIVAAFLLLCIIGASK